MSRSVACYLRLLSVCWRLLINFCHIIRSYFTVTPLTNMLLTSLIRPATKEVPLSLADECHKRHDWREIGEIREDQWILPVGYEPLHS